MLATTDQNEIKDYLRIPAQKSEADGALEDESFLTTEIAQLWESHKGFQSIIKQESQSLRELRGLLGKYLFHLKQVLAKPGRSGQWSSWLASQRIPRATADRLAAKYQRSLDPDGNCVSEAISEPTEEEIQKLLKTISPRLVRVLRTSQSQYRFLELLTTICGETICRATDEGLLIFKPSQQSAPVQIPTEGVVAEPPELPPTVTLFETDLEPL